MSPASRVATSSGLGAAIGGFVGFVVGFAGATAAGASPKKVEITLLLATAAGAVAGAAALGGYTEHNVEQVTGPNAPPAGISPAAYKGPVSQ